MWSAYRRLWQLSDRGSRSVYPGDVIAANKAASATDLPVGDFDNVAVTEELSRKGTAVAKRVRVDRGEESGVQTSME